MIDWKGQKIEPQPLTDLQANTKAINIFSIIFIVFSVLLLIMLLMWGFTWYYFDKHNILWNIITSCRGIVG